MKTIKGVTYSELMDKSLWCVEVEYDGGGRHWSHGTYAEMDPIIKRASAAGELSDVDIVHIDGQPEELRDCLREVMRLNSLHHCKYTWEQLFEMEGVA